MCQRSREDLKSALGFIARIHIVEANGFQSEQLHERRCGITLEEKRIPPVSGMVAKPKP